MTEEVNIYDSAHQLAKDLQVSGPYKKLEETLQKIREHEETNKLYSEFKDLSLKIQQQQMEGQEPDEEMINQLREMSNKISDNDLINELMIYEQYVSQMIAEINEIFTKPLNEIYKD